MADHFMLELSISRLQLHSALKYIEKRKTTIVPNGFGKWWLGNLVTRLGGNWEQYPCRGDITCYSLENENTLMIWQNTAWGETEPKSYYDWSTYKWCNGSCNTLTKYCTDSNYGIVDYKTELAPEDDAACAHYPGGRMPSVEWIHELRYNCTWQWTQRNGVNGQLGTGPNGNTIFLPVAGRRWHESLDYAGTLGNYWSRTLSSVYTHYAYNLYFGSGFVGWDYYDLGRGIGLPVRAVRVSQN